MDELLEESTLKSLFEERNGRIAKIIFSDDNKQKALKKEIEENLEDVLAVIPDKYKDDVKNEKESIIWKMLQYADNMNEDFYKFGIADGITLRKEIAEIRKKSNNEKCFFEKMEGFDEYIEEQKQKKLKDKEEYKKLNNEVENIMRLFPKVRNLIENEEVTDLSKEELESVLKIIQLNSDITSLEIREIFKIGIQEGRKI